jgi:two-component system response regulator HydG
LRDEPITGFGAMKILIVDDDYSILDTLRDVLEYKGHEVLTVGSGPEAIEMVGKDLFDVVLADIKMPGINGVDTFIEIKKISPETAVIMMTGFSVEELVQKALREGVYACVYKPFDIEKILKMLENIQKRTVILVVDDRVESVESLKDALEGKRQRVMIAKSGEQAVDIVRTEKVDIVLLDVVMPGISGVETLKKIKEIRPETTVVMMTAYAVEDMVQEAVKAGAYACITKPFNLEKVVQIIEEVRQKAKRREGN